MLPQSYRLFIDLIEVFTFAAVLNLIGLTTDEIINVFITIFWIVFFFAILRKLIDLELIYDKIQEKRDGKTENKENQFEVID